MVLMPLLYRLLTLLVIFFFNDTATTEIYTLSLHDALPIFDIVHMNLHKTFATPHGGGGPGAGPLADRKSTRLNSSHSQISYAVFCLKKKNHVYGEQWIKFMKDGVNATPLPTVNTTGYIDHA